MPYCAIPSGPPLGWPSPHTWDPLTSPNLLCRGAPDPYYGPALRCRCSGNRVIRCTSFGLPVRPSDHFYARFCHETCWCPRSSNKPKTNNRMANVDLGRGDRLARGAFPARSRATSKSGGEIGTCRPECSGQDTCSFMKENVGCPETACRVPPSLDNSHYELGRCLSVASLIGKRDVESDWACACNSSYVSAGCCKSSDGLLWEKPGARLGEMRLED
jgi:hypothetical protein